MRRAVIRSRRGRKAVIVAAVVLGLLAAATCSVRIARLWTSAAGAGPVVSSSVWLEHGRLVIERTSAPGPGASIPAVLNWQVEFGFNPDYEQTLMNHPAPAGGMVTTRTRAIPLAFPLFPGVAFLTLLCLPIGPRIREDCCPSCDYNLTGLDAPICPECGAAVTRATSAS